MPECRTDEATTRENGEMFDVFALSEIKLQGKGV